MRQLRFTLICALMTVAIMGTALQAYAYYQEETSPELNELALGPVYCPCDIPQPDPETATADQPDPLTYTVNAGDTLDHIANNFNVPLASLMAFNDIAEPKGLLIGEQLRIPSSEVTVPLPDGQSKTVKQVLNSTLTAYTAGVESTGKSASHPQYGITASGSRAEEGRTIAVDPSIIPIGTTVYIDGVGVRTAEDTGSKVRGARIDVFMNDVKEARTFGVKRNVKVYVLSEETV